MAPTETDSATDCVKHWMASTVMITPLSADMKWDPSMDLINFDGPVIEPIRNTQTDANANDITSPMKENNADTVFDTTNSTMTDLLTDSLTDWMSHMFTDFTVDCLLCMYSPLKCKGSCSYTSWDSADKQWIQMHNKELKYIHDKCYMMQDPKGVRHMRAKVLDWMFEVSSFYFLQRQTAYLAQDFLDRYLMAQDYFEKSSLQLVATTALYIAAKKEEINPPKITTFAFVTAGACEVWEIHRMEVKMLKALKWRLCPATPIAWLNIYSQIETEQSEENYLEPFFTQEVYIQITELLDLCILDIDSLDYSYSALAAAVVCHYSSYDVVHRISGMSWKSLWPCYWWMNPFKDSLRFDPRPELKRFPQVKPENSHNIQTHEVKRGLLRRAREGSSLVGSVGMTPLGLSGILTPPSSTGKTLSSFSFPTSSFYFSSSSSSSTTSSSSSSTELHLPGTSSDNDADQV